MLSPKSKRRIRRSLKSRQPQRTLQCEQLEARQLMDASAPAILQLFESSYANSEQRAADIFEAGFGSVWIPPTGRADSGNQSVGYDVYDRFDLGVPNGPTLYGTEQGVRTLVDVFHRAGLNVYADFVINHNGFRDSSTPGFVEEGGYPGFALTLPSDVDGDFHGAFESGVLNGRLAGLIDVAHETNHQFIRHPTTAGPNNIPAGTVANQPDPLNARFYPDTSLPPIELFDQITGEMGITIYPFNTEDPLAGDPMSENALGLILRNAQWLIQDIGVDGLRIDAARHVERFALEFLDRAVYRAIQTPLLDGSRQDAFLFSEIFTGDRDEIQNLIRKDIDPADPGRIGGNRDALDFPLFFALRDNLTSNGIVNDWRNITSASQDIQDDGFANNGSQGVAFASSHDEGAADLSNVAHAYILLRPGNAVVYYNAEEFGQERDFPRDGRGDALGGQFGDTITTLVDIRNTHGRGDYIDRTPGGDEKESLVFERSGSSLVVLSNRVDAGFDSRTVQTNFLPGTPLVELTGNAASDDVDPFNDFPEVVVVNGDGTVNIRIPRNVAPDGDRHDRGYFIYGPAGPQGALSLSNVDSTLGAGTATPETNGTVRVNDISVITADSFDVTLDTFAVNHLGSIRDQFADGDNALIKIDGGIDINGNSVVDFTTPNSPVYGFEEFTTFREPGFFEADGNGQYIQTVDTTTLSEGLHFVEVQAYRHREPGEGDTIYSSFKESIYVDRLKPESGVRSFDPVVAGVNENIDLRLESTDLTANSVHVFWDLPASLTESEILGMLDGQSQTNQIDRDLFSRQFNNVTSGNHVATVVTFEQTGNFNVQRLPGLFTSTIFGAGLGDLNFDGTVDASDMAVLESVFQSNNAVFNPAGDFNADGLIDINDLPLFYQMLQETGADATVLDAFDQFVINNVPVDYGDAPDSFGTLQSSSGPHHILTIGPFLGTSVDADSDGQPNATATGDDIDENNDDNGLLQLTNVVPGQTGTVTIQVSEPAKLDAWIDFNGDGSFQHPGEHLGAGTSIDVVGGISSFNFAVPADAVVASNDIRIRVSSLGDLSPLELAGDGEVEDYQVPVNRTPQIAELTINDGSNQRSNLTSIDLVFDAEVDAPAAAFEVRNRATDTVVSSLIVDTSLVSGQTLARLTFGDGDGVVSRGDQANSLIDGNYQVTVFGSQVNYTNTSIQLATDFVFGDEAADQLFRFFGDSDGDRDVDIQDLAGFGSAFRQTSLDEGFIDSFDHDGDLDVDIQDLSQFGNRFRDVLVF